MMIENLPRLEFSEYGEEQCAKIQAQTDGDVKHLIARYFFWQLYGIVNSNQSVMAKFGEARKNDEFVVPSYNDSKFTVSSAWFKDFNKLLIDCWRRAKNPFLFVDFGD